MRTAACTGTAWAFACFWILQFTTIRGDICGKPGMPLNGKYNPIKNSYNVSQEVNYFCDQSSYMLIGNSRRTCMSNGTWNSQVPICGNNLAYKKLINSSLTDNSYATYDYVRPKIPITVNLDQDYNIAFIVLVLNPHQRYSFNIDITDSSTKILRQCYAAFNQQIDDLVTKIQCNNGIPIRGRTVIFTFQNEVAVYDVGVFQNNEQCGDPDIPLHGIFDSFHGIFTCEEHYYLQGQSSSSCVRGEWNATNQACLHAPDGWVGCGEPGLPVNGDRYLGGQLQNESTYFCNKGYTIVGDPLRSCLSNGSWSPQRIPKCVSNMAFNKMASHQPGVFKRTLSVDGNLTTCESQKATYYGYIDLGDATAFNTITLSLKASDLISVTVYGTNNTKVTQANFMDKSVLTHICNVNFRPTTPLQCNYSIVARYVVIYSNKPTDLCEVIIFNSNEETACGQPDQPLHGRILNRSSSSTTYTCEHGYNLNGSATTNCIQGRWTTKPPTCVLTVSPTTVTAKPTIYPWTTTSRHYTITPWFATTSSPKESDPVMVLSIALGATLSFIVVIIVAILVFCFVRKHYKSRNRCDTDYSSRGSRSDGYSTTYKTPSERRAGDGDDVSIHLYDSIKDPEYMFTGRVDGGVGNYRDTVSNAMYDSSSALGNSKLEHQRPCLVPQKAPLYDLVASDLENSPHTNRGRMTLPSQEDSLLDCSNRPRTSL